VICRVLSLIYEFEFPNNMNIYSIILIIYLELVSKDSDFYNCFRNNYPISIKENLWNNIEKEWRKFEIEKFTNRRQKRYGRGKKITKYLIK
jgi:hypothetical protein